MDIFCKIINKEIPSNIVYETDDVIVIMDANPTSPGHLLIIPKKHYTTILDMDNEIIIKVHDIAKMFIPKMEKLYPNLISVKVIVNYGEEQQIKHYHMHLLPLYSKNNEPSLTQEEFANLLKEN